MRRRACRAEANDGESAFALRLRRDSLAQIWTRFRSAWHDPRVAQFVEELAVDPGKTRTLHQWVHL